MRLLFPARLLLAAALILGLGTQAPARDLTAAEKTSLTHVVTEFGAATRANDAPRVVKVVPPAILAFIAKSQGVQPEAMRQQLIAQSSRMPPEVKLLSFSLDMTQAKYQKLTNGQPYALIPTDMVMQVSAAKREMRSETLALLDKGRWYLVRISSPQQVKILVEAYPEFAGVKFTPETNKVVP